MDQELHLQSQDCPQAHTHLLLLIRMDVLQFLQQILLSTPNLLTLPFRLNPSIVQADSTTLLLLLPPLQVQDLNTASMAEPTSPQLYLMVLLTAAI